MARFAIGIDLGTSNCALEWSPLQGAEASVSTFNIRQYETPERVVESAVLPSFLYLKEHHSTAELPYVAGLMAREQFKAQQDSSGGDGLDSDDVFRRTGEILKDEIRRGNTDITFSQALNRAQK